MFICNMFSRFVKHLVENPVFFFLSSTLNLATAQSQYLMVIGRNGGLSPLCHCYRFVCQQSVLKIFPSLGLIHSEDR